MKTDWVKMVKEFHDHIGLPVSKHKCLDLSFKTHKRIEYLIEELEEYQKAYKNIDHKEVADALGDLVYFAIGTALCHGIDLRTVMEEIHKSNMTKTPNPNSHKLCDKGPDFKKPDMAKAIHEGDVHG